MIGSVPKFTEMSVLNTESKKSSDLNRKGSESVCAFCRETIRLIGHAACAERYSLCSDLQRGGYFNRAKILKSKSLIFGMF